LTAAGRSPERRRQPAENAPKAHGRSAGSEGSNRSFFESSFLSNLIKFLSSPLCFMTAAASGAASHSCIRKLAFSPAPFSF